MIKRIIKDFLIFGFATYGILWTLAESFGAFFEGLKPDGIFWYFVIIIISTTVGIKRALPRKSVTINVPNSDSCVELKFGDIFTNSESIVIPVNEFFDGKLGDNVSEKSLHGKFIKNILGGQSSTFNNLTEKTLKGITSEFYNRNNGRKNKYPIGTTAIVDINKTRYFLTALSKTDINTLKASATLHELWDALSGLWKAISHYSNGYTVSLPLIGSGLSGVGLPPKHIINQILTSFFYYTKQGKIAQKIIIIIPEDMYDKIDLSEIERSWK